MKKGDKILLVISAVCILLCIYGYVAHNNNDWIDIAKQRNSKDLYERELYWNTILILSEEYSVFGMY